MASRCNPHFLIGRLSLQLLVLTMTWPSAVTESAALIQLRGEVGGKVTFHCPVDKKQTLEFLYFQKGETFVNGYHASGNVSTQTWENTRVDLDKTLLMYNLKVSHSGDYQCIIQYSGKWRVEPEIHLHLNVTANYSKPTLKVHCSDENHHFSCLVNCTSHGGYPATEVTWNIPGSMKVVNNSKMTDPDTTTFHISSIAFVNCSDGKLSLSCSVGDVSSEMRPVCTPKDPLVTRGPNVIAAAICAVVVVSIMAAVLGIWHCKKGQRRAKVAGSQENECEEEETVLNEIKESS
ncbi:butyrophilin subfamily 1 member A1 isoform X1 [Cebidichthys violaceus]|uniref:butyrophilin subfamily 1 member A1 isoform X1 n=1 Tax=Cebidichthys violaceus TaxID=271503 RepID=UPI0035C949B3